MKKFSKDTLKILIVEDGQYYMYGGALREAFKNQSYKNVELFSWQDSNIYGESLFGRIQGKMALGPEVGKINRKLIKKTTAYQPDLVFLYRCRIIYSSTVKKIKKLGATIFSYNNDNPFSKHFPNYYWRHYRKAIIYDDVTFVYRKSNIEECLKAGAKQVDLLRSYYIKESNYPIKDVNKKLDVVFLGHYENDERINYIRKLTEKKIYVGVPKDIWKGIEEENEYILRLENTHAEYNQLLNESKIALVFLSALNKDTYTRRCFEIPATRTFMLSQYTDDLASLFEPDKEAVYFRNQDELVQKVKYYLEHEKERNQIAEAGYERLLKDGHEIENRVIDIMNIYRNIR